jgi:Ca2+-transporting ATPase
LDDPLFGRAMILTGLVQGLGVLAVVMGIYAYAYLNNFGETEARMMAFVTLVLANLGLIFTNRSWTHSILATLRVPNKALWWVTGGAVGFLALSLSLPILRSLFQFGELHRWEVIAVTVAVTFSILVAESVKTRLIQHWLHG